MYNFLSSQSRLVELKGHSINLNEVETALLGNASVEDCRVLIRTRDNSESELVPYLVSAEPLCPSRLKSSLQEILLSELLPKIYIPVSRMPLTAEGQVDEAALMSVEAIAPELIEQWSTKLQRLSGVAEVAVQVRDRAESPNLLHISDLIPDWKAVGSGIIEKSIACGEKNPSQGQVSGKLAISYGEPLQNKDQIPPTLPNALHQAALNSPDKGVIYVQPNDDAVFQTYPELLEQAQRILAGFRKLGLKPQDKVIFQLPNNQDFIATFWGCLLGGFVPVPLSVASTYQEANSAIKKLHNAWQMLDRPVIVTSKDLELDIAAVPNLTNGGSFEIATVETLQNNQSDENWHESQPEDLALLLLTSGSTGLPKAVMLSHSLILYRAACSSQRHKMNRDSVSLNWLPLDHVSGIAQFHVRDIYLGCQQVHAPTDMFVQNPLKWLDLIDRYRVNISWAPNFAYGLVNDRAREIIDGDWDLSSMQIFLNAGEAIAPQTAHSFMELLTPHKLPSEAMNPAWGMSETAGAVVFSDRYSLDSASEDSQFVETGSPSPDFSIRIVDEQDQVVNEEVIGALQIKGTVVTSGYYQNPQANQTAFTADGWFNTGDLGLIRDGRLTVTGRKKDVIIINGFNYYCHEIEAIVEEIEEIEVSYTAACGFRTANSTTDRLAIFFHTANSEAKQLLEVLNKIRGSIVQKVGVNPTYLIPVEKEAIPKTGIGKIQRSQLKQRLEAGEFDPILKQIDILSSNTNTLPDWFYRQSWQRQEIERFKNIQSWQNTSLIFLDKLGLGSSLGQELSKINQPWIGIEIGTSFARISPNHYQIDPQNPDHYRQLWSSFQADNIQIDRIVHLWAYETYQGEAYSLEDLENAQNKGIYSLLSLVQTLEQNQNSEQPLRLLTISSHTQSIATDEKIAYEKSPLLGISKTIPQELPWLHCTHIDLSLDPVEVNARHILRELCASLVESEVAYRDGKRLVTCLEKADLSLEKSQDLPFKHGRMYLITGGLGKFGSAIAQYLLQYHQAKLLLVGRTSLPERNTWSSHKKRSTKLAEKIKTYSKLEQLGGEVTYQAVDICDFPKLQQIVNQTKSNWQCELEGIINLAGIYQERLLIEETPDSLAQILRPQVIGASMLPQLLPEKSNGLLISFASVNGFFGDYKVGALAAASSFLKSFSAYQHNQKGLQSYCFAWSMWDEVGISRGYQPKKQLRDRGYHSIQTQQGLYSLIAALHHNPSSLLIGLDGNNPRLRNYLKTKSPQAQKLRAYIVPQVAPIPVSQLQEIEVKDDFGVSSTCEFIQVKEIPTITNEQTVKERKEIVLPRNDLERQITRIWQEVLDNPSIGIYDNFFELGGHSLLATQVISRSRQTFKVELPLQSLFETSTIAGFAQTLIKHEPQPGMVSKIAQLRETISSMSAEEIKTALLNKRGDNQLKTGQ
ncbi:conserved hypothetical protein [Hyella patelloides LEGE 07179]|uniref:Carrier domain-containing protein n=1 Tax=Hyella patelloides LEGE 07179 TaxID=945734 RepID=A0A563VZF6_9CYAN|nr:SDR family NAD(P)-dependent oxidoreductase [Hyella patelloides]VEP16809.1 conserved hypothetical protein [Hyella patelloides LEGE 07179]